MKHSRFTLIIFFSLFISLLIGCDNQESTNTVESWRSKSDVQADSKFSKDKTLTGDQSKGETENLNVNSTSEEEKAIFAELTTAYLPITANLPLFVALDHGLFEKYGLKVKAIEATTPNDIITGIVSGNIDFADVLAYTLLFPASQQFPSTFKLFGSTEETESQFTSSIIALTKSSIESEHDLKGKKIGVYTGLVQVNFLKAILVGIGISEKEVEIVEISPRLQIQGLVSGQYDALSSTEPTTNIAVEQGIAKVVVANPRVKYIMAPFPSTAFPISTKLLSENPEAARAVVWALDDAIDFINENRNVAVQSLANYTPIPKDNTQEILGTLKLFRYNKIGEENRLNVQRFADYMFEIGLLKKPIEDVNQLFGDRELVKR